MSKALDKVHNIRPASKPIYTKLNKIYHAWPKLVGADTDVL